MHGTQPSLFSDFQNHDLRSMPLGWLRQKECAKRWRRSLLFHIRRCPLHWGQTVLLEVPPVLPPFWRPFLLTFWLWRPFRQGQSRAVTEAWGCGRMCTKHLFSVSALGHSDLRVPDKRSVSWTICTSEQLDRCAGRAKSYSPRVKNGLYDAGAVWVAESHVLAPPQLTFTGGMVY